jgi:hypothetical protein
MLRSTAVARVQRRLGFRKDIAVAICDEMISAQDNFERGVPVPIVASAYMGRFLAGGGSFLPWFLLTEVNTIQTAIGEERVSLPDDFIREYEEDALYYFNPAADPTIGQNQWIPLWKNDLQYNREKYGAMWPSPTGNPPTVNQSCGPRGYSLDASYFRIFPLPDQIYTLKMIYYGHDDVLDPTVDSENKWLKNAPAVLMGEAGYNIAAAARDADRMTYFEKLRDESLARLFVDTEARQHENRRYQMGRED